MNPRDRQPALSQSYGLPLSPEGAPVFAEPWQASAFAMAVHLNERGVFSWNEWAEVLSAELHKPGARSDSSDYFDCWVRALTRLISELQITSQAEVEDLTQAWKRAAEATPHGKPIVLENDPDR